MEKFAARRDELLKESTLLDFQVADVFTQRSLMAGSLCKAIYKHGERFVREKFLQLNCKVLYTNLSEEVDHFTTNYAIATNLELKTVFVVFRGSQNAKDWMTNFRAVPHQVFENISMHKGFASAVKGQWKKQIQPILLELINTPDYDQLLLCGHSLGGALATGTYLYWMDIQREMGTSISTELFTFGAPLSVHYRKDSNSKVKDFSFVEEDNIFNFVNNSDLVPRLLGGKCLGPRRGYSRIFMGPIRRAAISSNQHWVVLGRYFYIHGGCLPESQEDEDELVYQGDEKDDAEIEDTSQSECEEPESIKLYELQQQNVIEFLKLPFTKQQAKSCIQQHAMKRYQANLTEYSKSS